MRKEKNTLLLLKVILLFYAPLNKGDLIYMKKKDCKKKQLVVTSNERKPFFSSKNIAVMAMLTAISFILYILVKMPLPFIFPGFLDMQFSDLPALLGGFALGPTAGGVIIVMKCLIKMPFSSTACVGELADIIIGLAYVVPASIYYKFYRTRRGAIISMILGTICAVVCSLFANAFIIIPFYVNTYGMDIILNMVSDLYPGINSENFMSYYLPLAVLPFNTLRCGVCALITYFAYKPVSNALKWERKSK